MNYRVVAIIVTFNRLNLLQEAIDLIKSQTFSVEQIIVINNSSTDGTAEWLSQQPNLNIIEQENSGGSGGFYTGIKQAVLSGFDWAWVMDDDTICRPDALEMLVNKLPLMDNPVGFLSSKCIWTDGTPHLMNIPAITPSFNNSIPFNTYDENHMLLVENSSFVSVLINVKAVKQLGLPYKEFFIWGDDQEYTRRITKAGYLGIYCTDSVVVHKTPSNYFPDFYRDNVNNLWKHSYGFRNEFFMVKRSKGFLYYIFWMLGKLGYTSYKLLRIRKDNQLKFIGVLLNSGWKSIGFNPKIDKV
ncbi:glycosyltransferase family 2 protein [Mucilaginibacter sp.]|uniref:glycosyltransferase family 2 protein n=1 Tax=Mucilaginibacter sp. TaxID=1882438 RepID=UPI003D1427CC